MKKPTPPPGRRIAHSEAAVPKAMIIGCIVILLIIVMFAFTSCQPTLDPLREATFPCECTYKGYDYEIHFQCQDKTYKFKDEKYYKTHDKGDVIKQPLNK